MFEKEAEMLGHEAAMVDDEWRAGFFVDDKGLTIEFGAAENPQTLELEFKNANERIVVEQMLAGSDFWNLTLMALSTALSQALVENEG